MPIDDLVSFAPWLIAGAIWAIAFFLALNHALAAVGLDGFTAGHEGGPVDAAPDGTDDLYDHFYRQLVALGMRPAGITWEKIAAKPKLNSFAFLHPTKAYRASVWRMLGGDFRVYWITQFNDAGAVLTANYLRPTWTGPGYLARGIPTNDLAMLLDEHRRDVANMVTTGREPVRCSTLDDVVEAKLIYHHSPIVRRQYQHTQWTNFLSRMFLVGGLPCGLAFIATTRHWVATPTSAWLLGLAACAFFAVRLHMLRGKVLQQLSNEQRKSDEAREPHASPS